MRLVMSRPAAKGDTYQQKQLRSHFRENRRQFMAEAAKLEAELLAARAKVTGSPDVAEGPGKADVGSETAIGLAERWMGEWDANAGNR
jgi:hypothetical protein